MKRTQARAVQLVGHAWTVHGGLTETDRVAFVAAAVPVVRAAQYRTAHLMAAYLTALAALHGMPAPKMLDPEDVAGMARRGVDPETVYSRPIIEARTVISRGGLYLPALAAGLIRASTLAATDVILANRAAASGATGEGITGYERVLSGQGCELCTEAAGGVYAMADLMPIHDHCECDVAPIYGDARPAAGLNESVIAELPAATTDLVDGEGDTPPLVVSVEDHGELGPILTNAAHEWQSDPVAA